MDITEFDLFSQLEGLEFVGDEADESQNANDTNLALEFIDFDDDFAKNETEAGEMATEKSLASETMAETKEASTGEKFAYGTPACKRATAENVPTNTATTTEATKTTEVAETATATKTTVAEATATTGKTLETPPTALDATLTTSMAFDTTEATPTALTATSETQKQETNDHSKELQNKLQKEINNIISNTQLFESSSVATSTATLTTAQNQNHSQNANANQNRNYSTDQNQTDDTYTAVRANQNYNANANQNANAEQNRNYSTDQNQTYQSQTVSANTAQTQNTHQHANAGVAQNQNNNQTASVTQNTNATQNVSQNVSTAQKTSNETQTNLPQNLTIGGLVDAILNDKIRKTKPAKERAKSGRKPIKKENKQNQNVTFYLSPLEHKELEKLALKSRDSIGVFMKKIALNLIEKNRQTSQIYDNQNEKD